MSGDQREAIDLNTIECFAESRLDHQDEKPGSWTCRSPTRPVTDSQFELGSPPKCDVFLEGSDNNMRYNGEPGFKLMANV